MKNIIRIVLLIMIVSWAVCGMANDEKAEQLYRKASRTLNIEKAKKYMSMAVETAPNNPKYREALAEMHIFFAIIDIENRNVALRELEKVKELNPDEPRIRYRLAMLYMKDDTGLDSKAKSELEKVRRFDVLNTIADFEMAYLSYKNDMSEAMWQAVIEGNSESKKLKYYPSVLSMERGDSIMGIALESGLGLDSFSHFRAVARGLNAYADSLSKEGEIEKAIDVRKSIILMGRKVMESEPLRLLNLLVGVAIQQLGYSDLENYFTELSDNEKINVLEAEKSNLQKITDRCIEYTESMMPKLISRVNMFFAPTLVLSPIPTQLFLILIAGIYLLVLKRKAKRKTETENMSLPLQWRKIFIMFGLLYVVVCGFASVIVFYINAHLWEKSLFSMFSFYLSFPILSVIIGIIIYVIPIRQSYLIWRGQPQFNAHGFIGFVRKGSFSIKLAMVRRQILLLGVGTLILIFIGIILTAGYRIRLGVYPWWPDYGFGLMADEEQFVERILVEFPHSTELFK